MGISVVIFGSILTSSFGNGLVSCIGLSHFHLFSSKYFNGVKRLIYINLCTVLHHPFWLQLILGTFGTFDTTLFWPRIADEGSVPEMHIWSILLI